MDGLKTPPGSRLRSVCEVCGRRGITLPTLHQLDKIPAKTVLGSETRWLLLYEGTLWVALPGSLTTDQSCIELRLATGVSWIRRCPVCILRDAEGSQNSEELTGRLFGSRRPEFVTTLRTPLGVERIRPQLEAVVIRQANSFNRQAVDRARRAQYLHEFLGLLTVEEGGRDYPLLIAAASRECAEEAAGLPKCVSIDMRRRGRPSKRPNLTALVRFVLNVYSGAGITRTRKNLWRCVAGVVSPYLVLHRPDGSRRLSEEAFRQLTMRLAQ